MLTVDKMRRIVLDKIWDDIVKVREEMLLVGCGTEEQAEKGFKLMEKMSKLWRDYDRMLKICIREVREG